MGRISMFWVVFSTCLAVTFSQRPIIEIAQGQLQGQTKTSDFGRPYSEFLSIPFAKPPVGELRFAAPVPADPWSGILDASKNPPFCPQTPSADILVLGQDDCLYLNVYSPILPNATYNPNLPVIVWIYGGGYSRGGAQTYYYGPERFMDYDVVMVAMNYRVGPFGYLSTLDAAASGNFGALDQVLALKWVQSNVAAFGGNPNQVTIQGESAGSTSVSYLVLSPAASGLFHAAIGESGSALCSWSLQKDPLNFTMRLANDVGCPIDDSFALVNCLRNRSVDDIVNAAWKLGDYNVIGQPFVNVIEDPEVGQFITEWPSDILKAGTFNKVPYLTGVNHDEGVISYEISKRLYDTIDQHFFDVILPTVIYGFFKYDHNLVNASYAVKAEYYDKINTSDPNAVVLTSIDINTDAVFLAPNDMYVKMLASNGIPVYTYLFSFTGTSSVHNYANQTQVCHGDDLYYLFKFLPFPFAKFTDDDALVSKQMLEMWTNFATYHNPTPNGVPQNWQATTPTEANYLNILVPDQTATIVNYRSEKNSFWDDVVTNILLAD